MNIPPVEADSPLHVATPASLQEECPPETGGRKNIHLTISYDGTNFCGWPRQDKAAAGRPVRTVQGELERALEKLAKEPVEVIGSGRTDSGVHAYGQAANFFSLFNIRQNFVFVIIIGVIFRFLIKFQKAVKFDNLTVGTQ